MSTIDYAGAVNNVHWIWKALFPVKSAPHYDIPAYVDATPDLLPFLPLVVGVGTFVTICTL
jgi:hypothetical protein